MSPFVYQWLLFAFQATMINAAGCPPGWIDSQFYCYLRAPTNDQWNSIQHFCSGHTARLPVFVNEDEFKDFVNTIDWPTLTNVWIGLFLADPTAAEKKDRSFRYVTDCGSYGSNVTLASMHSAWDVGYPAQERRANRVFLSSATKKMRNIGQHNNLYSGYCQRLKNQGECKPPARWQWNSDYTGCQDSIAAAFNTAIDSRFCDLDNRREFALGTCSQCGGTYTALTGQICTQNHPSYYKNQISCVYIIQLPPGQTVRLEFVHLDTELDTDYVTVYDGNQGARQLASLSGYQLPKEHVFVSSTNVVTISFTTDIYDYFTGFKALYGPARCPNQFIRSLGKLNQSEPFETNSSPIQYSCPPNYVDVQANEQRKVYSCLRNGSWDQKFVECTATCDPRLASLENGNASGMNLSNILNRPTAGSVVSFQCNDGYRLVGVDSLLCQDDGEWSTPPPVCQFIEIPKCPNQFEKARGHVNASEPYTKNSGPVLYSCPGNHMLGEQNAVSQVYICSGEGRWNQNFVECTATCDDKLVEIANGTRLPLAAINILNRTIAGNAVSFHCENGFELFGSQVSLCTSNGTWSMPAPTCQIITTTTSTTTTTTTTTPRLCADLKSFAFPVLADVGANVSTTGQPTIRSLLKSLRKKIAAAPQEIAADYECLCQGSSAETILSVIDILEQLLISVGSSASNPTGPIKTGTLIPASAIVDAKNAKLSFVSANNNNLVQSSIPKKVIAGMNQQQPGALPSTGAAGKKQIKATKILAASASAVPLYALNH